MSIHGPSNPVAVRTGHPAQTARPLSVSGCSSSVATHGAGDRSGNMFRQTRIAAASFWLCLVFLVLTSPLRALAQDASSIPEAQRQVSSAVGPMMDSEAEYAAGSYIPGVGAVFTLSLLRGPNSVTDRPPHAAVRDWMIYLLQTFGSRLTAVPPGETIAITVSYYDYSDNGYHLLTMSSLASTVTDPGSYSVWLDGVPYGEATAAKPATSEAPPAETPAQVETPSTSAEPTDVPGSTAVPAALEAGPVDASVDFANDASLGQWKAVSGSWGVEDGTYRQTETGQFDLVSYYATPISGDYRISADVQWVSGNMGAGLVFNAPESGTKKGAHMISFAGNGTYVQWGFFDGEGVFQYQGGTPIPATVADGAWHTLAVNVIGSTYSVSLDGVELGTNVPANGSAGGYAGLLVSTSDVRFDNVRIEPVTP